MINEIQELEKRNTSKNLSAHFTVAEFTRSQLGERYGLDNSFRCLLHRQNAIKLCSEYLEPVRRKIKSPIVISSGYRTQEINRLVGGAKNSAHILGEAVDFTPVNSKMADVFDVIISMSRAGEIPVFDQLIWEFGWIHLGISSQPRGEILRAYKFMGKTFYLPVRRAPR